MLKRMFSLLVVLMLGIAIAPAQGQEDTLSGVLSAYVSDDEPGMVLYILYDDGSDEISVAGLADVEAGTPIQEDDVFRIGSTTKMMVATLVLQLVDEGVVELDDHISDYIPADIAENIANADTSTVRQMLNMTSGIFDYTESDDFDDAIYEDEQHQWQAEEVLSYIFGEDAYFDPGSEWYYTNSNYVLAHILIESVTGNSLAIELENRIFAPVGMPSCYLEDTSRLAEGLMPGYIDWGGGDYEDISRINDGLGLGDGGVICNAIDLALFPIALIEGDLLSDDALAEMGDFVDTGDGGGYGLGLSYKVVEGYDMYGHEGSTSGFNSDLQYIEDEGTVIVILSNNFDSDVMEDVLAAAVVWATEE